MSNILFSIICPVFNGRVYIKQCIDSVINQTYSNWELVIVDDGSTDDTLQICNKYISDKIKVFHKSNSGQYDSRIYGFNKSEGTHILFLDSDDLLANNALETIRSYILKNDVDVLTFNYKTFSDSNIPTRDGYVIKKNEIINNNKKVIQNYFYRYFFFSLCTSCFKRPLFNSATKNDANKPNGKFGEDVFFVYELLKNVESAMIVTDVLYFYRMHQHSVTHTKSVELDHQRVLNLNYIFSNLFKICPPPSDLLTNIIQKLSWPVFNYIYSSAVCNRYRQFKIHCLSLNKLYICKKYFRKKGVSGFVPKLIVSFFRIKLYLFLYIIVRFNERKTGYYEKSSF